MTQLDQLNKLTRDLYDVSDPIVRQEAERNLSDLQSSEECPDACLLLLQQGQMPYAPIVACTTLLNYVTNKKCTMSCEHRLYLSRHLLSYLSERGLGLQPFALTAICHLLARITKVGWKSRDPLAPPVIDATDDDDELTSYPFRQPIYQLMQQLNVEREQESLLGLHIINALVDDFSSDVGFDTLYDYRKELNHFRDGILGKLFAIALQFLRDFVVDAPAVREECLPFLDKILDLALKCASFNFLAVTEEQEESASIQYPCCWKLSFRDGRPIDMITHLYLKLPIEFTERILHLAVQIVGVRRQLIQMAERDPYLNNVVSTVIQIILNSGNLNEPGAFHQFCRLVARVKSNFHAKELYHAELYSEFIRAVADFTTQSFTMPSLSQSSISYLLQFWAKLAAANTYTRMEVECHQLEVLGPKVFNAYLESRLANVNLVANGELEDPLQDQASVVCAMEQLAVIGRLSYQNTCNIILKHVEENIRVLQSASAEDRVAKIAEERLSWLVMFAGAGIYGSEAGLRGTAPEEHDKIDGRLMGTCINIMRLTDQAVCTQGTAGQMTPPNGCSYMEMAFIFLIDCFRKSYINSSGKINSSVYETLAEEAQISDEDALFAFLGGKLSNNLKFWGLNEEILDLSLQLLKELARGYASVRKLLKTPQIRELVSNHADLPFLSPQLSLSVMKNRTNFYESIARILFTDVRNEYETDAFDPFVKPFKERVDFITSVLNGECLATEDETVKMIVGLCRDLKGTFAAATTKMHYYMLLDVMHPNLFQIVIKCVAEWPSRPEILVPVFRLLEEIVMNRHERLKQGTTDYVSILLFRHISTVISLYTENYARLPPLPEKEMYSQRYKPIGCLFRALKYSLVGGYVPFGVFKVFEDDSWEKSLRSFIQLATNVDADVLTVHNKFAEAYYTLLEAVIRSNISFISHLDERSFIFILKSLQMGLDHSSPAVTASAYPSLEEILNFFFRRMTQPAKPCQFSSTGPEGDECLRAIEQQPEILAEIMATTFHKIIYGQMSCQWAMSRCLVVLILLQPDVYTNIMNQVLQLLDNLRRPEAQQSFEKLMEGVERDVSVNNKDRFTQNLNRFMRDMTSVMRHKDPFQPRAKSNASSDGRMVG